MSDILGTLFFLFLPLSLFHRNFKAFFLLNLLMGLGFPFFYVYDMESMDFYTYTTEILIPKNGKIV